MLPDCVQICCFMQLRLFWVGSPPTLQTHLSLLPLMEKKKRKTSYGGNHHFRSYWHERKDIQEVKRVNFIPRPVAGSRRQKYSR